MPFNHEAVAALPVPTAADKALVRAMSTRRFAYALTAAESATNFVAIDPDTSVIPLYLIQGGSLFAYDSADSTTTHDGITCLVSSDGKRFKTTDFTAFVGLLTKSSVGLGNVDNTSDATKNAAVATLTNKTIGGALQTAAPTTKTVNYSHAITDSSLIFNGAGSITLTLLSAASFPGCELWVKNIAAFTVVSASANVVPLVGGAASTAVLAATAGKWALLKSDGTNWQIMAAN